MLSKMSMKQKIISGFFALCVAVSLAIGVCVLQAQAADSKLSYEEYKADYYRNYTGYNYFMSDDFVLPYMTLVEHNRGDLAYRSMVNAWQIATFDLSDIVDFSKKKAAYFEAFLFDCIYNGNEPTNGSELLNKSVKALQSSTMKKVCELQKWNLYETGSKALSTMSTEETTALLKNLQTCSELTDVFGAISDVGTVLNYASDVEELIHKLCKVAVIIKVGKEYADIISEIGNRTSDASMKFACSELSLICSNQISQAQIIYLMSADVAASDLTKWFLSGIWDDLLATFDLYGIAVKVGQSLGKFASGILFSTDKVVENYYEMDALYDFGKQMKAVVKSYGSKYDSNKNFDNSKHFNAAYEMLLNTYVLGCDISTEYCKLYYEGGVIGWCWSMVTGRMDEYNKILNQIKTVKDSLLERISFANSDLYNCYLDEYCNDVADVIDMQPVTQTWTKAAEEKKYTQLAWDIFVVTDVTITKDLTLTKDLSTYGDLYFKDGTIDLNGYTLSVGGNVIQSGGQMYIHEGTLEIGGDYRIQTFQYNQTYDKMEYVGSSGYIKMNNTRDYVKILGDFYTQSSQGVSNKLLAGTMEIGGNFKQINYNTSTSSFACSGSHKVRLIGSGEQHISFDSTSSYFNDLELINTNVKFDTEIKGWTLQRDTTFGNGLENGTTGTFDLNGHKLIINGNLYQSAGTMYINKGSMTVTGDYRIQKYSYNQTYDRMDFSGSEGRLVMDSVNDYVKIYGDFYTQSSQGVSNKLLAGTMEIGGNFKQINYNTSTSSFACSGIHTVILNGLNNIQKISFDSTSSHFNNLKLTKDKDTGYIFNPDNCWNNLYLDTDVKSVSIISDVKYLKPMDIYTLYAKVEGINKPSQEVVWQLTGNTDYDTTIDSYGIVTVGEDEKAEKITITATSVADDSKSATLELSIVRPTPVVLGIRINPTIVSAVNGERCQFEAVTYGLYKPAQGVMWSVSGNSSTNTSINSDGLLTIAEDETAEKITVTAMSIVDTAKSSSVTVDIYQIKIISTVSSVTVTMATGETQKLQAVVTGSNNPNQKVTWTVGGNESVNTVINANGELTVGEDETAKTIIVRAVSVENPEKYGEFAINIATSDEPKYQIGDTNLDGIVSIGDVTAIQRYLAELETFTDEQIALADTNGDGEINISDATHLQMYLAEFDGIVLGKS